MCKRCVTLTYQLSLCTLTLHVAKLWAKQAPTSERPHAADKLRAAEQLLGNAESALLRHRRESRCEYVRSERSRLATY